MLTMVDDPDAATVQEVIVRTLLGAARKRVAYGHNDTCASRLGNYACACGHDDLSAALGKVREAVGEPMTTEHAHRLEDATLAIAEQRDTLYRLRVKVAELARLAESLEEQHYEARSAEADTLTVDVSDLRDEVATLRAQLATARREGAEAFRARVVVELRGSGWPRALASECRLDVASWVEGMEVSDG